MSDKATYSALQKKNVTVPAHSVTTIDYIDTQPNYFRVQNSGDGTLYCSTANIPTQKQHDFSVKAAGMKMFAEPFYRAKLYVLNSTGNDVNITVLSFRAVFDPLALALSDIAIDLEGATIESENVISGFETSLPAGSNEIGKVQVSSLPALPTGENHIGQVDVSNLKDYTAALANILTAIGGISGGGSGGSSAWGTSQIDNLLSVMQKKNTILKANEGSATTAGVDIVAAMGGMNLCKIHTIANDGETDLTVTIKSANVAANQTFTLKAGEVFNDVEGVFDVLTLTGDSVPYRVVATMFTAG